MKNFIFIIILFLLVPQISTAQIDDGIKKEIKTKKRKNNNTYTFNKEFFLIANFAYSNAPQYSYGFSLGQVKRFGWYITAMSSFCFKGLGTDVKCNKDGWIDFGIFQFLPFYSGEKSTTRISGMAGLVVRAVPALQFNLGVGYGYRALFWETTDKKWVQNQGYSHQGIDTELGVAAIIKGFIISVNAVTTNFNTLELKAGIGWSF